MLLDGRKMTTRQAAHAELREELGLPEHYGANLDALWDCVSTMEARVRLIHGGEMKEALGGYGLALLDTLRQAAQENPAFHFEWEE